MAANHKPLDNHLIYLPREVGIELDEEMHELSRRGAQWHYVRPLDVSETWLSPIDTSGCLWDAITTMKALLPSYGTDTDYTIQQTWGKEHERAWIEDHLVPFMRRWGIDDHEEYPHLWLLDWLEHATFFDDALTTLVATEEGRLVEPALLWKVGEQVRYPLNILVPEIDATVPHHVRETCTVEEQWTWARDNSAGQSLQRAVITGALNRRQPVLAVVAEWNEAGRRTSLVAMGWRGIASAQLLTLFAASETLYICSQCGKPFQVDESERKPREGFGRYCSTECKRLAKLASNRASWHRNKDKWKKSADGA